MALKSYGWWVGGLCDYRVRSSALAKSLSKKVHSVAFFEPKGDH